MTFDRLTYDIERYQRLKSEYVAILGGACKRCGSTNDLEFDHVDPKTKKFAIGSAMFRPREAIIAELKKCQLLCGSCHDQKSGKERGVDHGQGLTGKRNCRCDLCRPLKNAWNRAYKKEMRQRI